MDAHGAWCAMQVCADHCAGVPVRLLFNQTGTSKALISFDCTRSTMISKNELKQALDEHERHKRRRRSVEAVLLLLVAVPAIVAFVLWWLVFR